MTLGPIGELRMTVLHKQKEKNIFSNVPTQTHHPLEDKRHSVFLESVADSISLHLN